MRVLVFASRRNSQVADEIAEGIRAEDGVSAIRIGSKHYKGEQHAGIDQVVHDGSDERVLMAHPDAEHVNFMPPEEPADEPEPEAPQVAEPEPEAVEADGELVEDEDADD